MMNRISYILILYSCIVISLQAQPDSLSLRQCLKAVQKHAIYNTQFTTISELAELKTDNIKTGNLPSLTAYGSSWFQSDAVSIQLPNGPGIDVDQFQYNAGIEAQQKLFDGGLIAKAIEAETAAKYADLSKVEIDLYKLSKQTIDLFFGSLLLMQQENILQLKKEILIDRIHVMQVGVKNGIFHENDLEKLKTELLLVEQQEIQITKAKLQNLSSISILTDGSINAQTKLYVSDSKLFLTEKRRPELEYFDAETQKLEKLSSLQKAKRLPKVYAYGQAGYSYPGMNFFENQPDYYYIVGAKLSWTIFDWKDNKREVKILRKRKELIDVNLAKFNQKIDMSFSREELEQQRLLLMIDLDNKILQHRKRITTRSKVALEKGTITSSDYLTDLNSEMEARINAASHSLQLQHSRFTSSFLKGIDNRSF